MHPEKNRNRRSKRTSVMQRTEDKSTYYTDASHNAEISKAAVVGHDSTLVKNYLGVPTPHDAELLAVMLAITEMTHTSDTITIRTDSQSACRDIQNDDLPYHIRTKLHMYMHAHPLLRIRIQWVPGHQGLRGNVRAHQLTRAENPGPPILWPVEDTYNPREEQKMQRKERIHILKSRREASTILNTPSYTHSREDASIIRKAQTHTLLTPHYTHYINRDPGSPTCKQCGAYPSNKHILWECPANAIFKKTILSKLPHNQRPGSWEEWTTPPRRFEKLWWPLLVQHVKNVLGQEA